MFALHGADPESPKATVTDVAPAPASALAAASVAGSINFQDEEEFDDYDDFSGYGVAAESSADLAASTGIKSQATLTDCSHAALPDVGELLQDRVKLLLCGGVVLMHSVALMVLDVLMMRRRCSSMLGGSFAVFAASLTVAIATGLLAFVRVFGRRAIVIVACVWVASLTMDACWVCLTFPQLDIANCLGTAMIGVTAVGLVACPASLVAFVIMYGWYRVKPSESQ